MAFTPLVTCHDAVVTFPGADTAREKMNQGQGMRCFDFCSSVKPNKALGLPANCLTSSVVLSSGVPLSGAAALCSLEPTERTSHPVVFAIRCCARSTRCLLTVASLSTAQRLCFLMFLTSSAPPLPLAGIEWSLE